MYSFFEVPVVLSLVKSAYKDILLKELEVYKNEEIKGVPLLITDDWTQFKHQIISNNPSSHFFSENIIYIKNQLIDVAFEFDSDSRQLVKVFFKLNSAKNAIHREIRKFLNIQFTNRIQNIGQIFHENIMIPLSFFQKDLVPIHASGVVVNNKVCLLGGTGGVGKTTLELEFCFNENDTFLTDDIAIANVNKKIYPNYNYPKIYGYNLIGNKKLKSILFKNKSVFNKFQWAFHKYFFGLSKIRRKISPFDLYKNVTITQEDLNTYFLLHKNRNNDLSITDLSVKEAVKMSIEVMMTEYSWFLNHIRFHEYNAVGMGIKPIVTCKELEEKWQHNLLKVLEATSIGLLNIPLDIDHTTFKQKAVPLIQAKLK